MERAQYQMTILLLLYYIQGFCVVLCWSMCFIRGDVDGGMCLA